VEETAWRGSRLGGEVFWVANALADQRPGWGRSELLSALAAAERDSPCGVPQLDWQRRGFDPGDASAGMLTHSLTRSCVLSRVVLLRSNKEKK